MKNTLLVLVMAVVFTVLVFAGGSGESTKPMEEVMELKYYTTQSESNVMVRGIKVVADQIRERTNGRIEIVVYTSGQLGSEQEGFDMVRSGALAMDSLVSRCFRHLMKTSRVLCFLMRLRVWIVATSSSGNM